MKLGNLDVPNYPLMDSVDAVKRIYEQLKRDEITTEHIAGVLGYTPRSGGFNVRVFDLKLYGFIEGRGKVRVTDLAVKATFGTPEERAIALDTAVRNVPLWKVFIEKWGTNIPAETFYIDLATIAGIERSESKNEADKIRKQFIEDSRYLSSVKPAEKGTETQACSLPDDPTVTSETRSYGSPQAFSPAIPSNIPRGCSFIYHPELPAPIVINSVRTFRAAKIFWEAIEEEWSQRPVLVEKIPVKDAPSELEGELPKET